MYTTLRTALLPIALIALLPALLRAADTPPKIAAVSEKMSAFAGKEIPGIVTFVATKDGVVHLDAAGESDADKHTPMTVDSIFWIASMTKPVTGTAVMMLAEEGKLSIDDPVAKYIPELAELKTPDGKPANITIKHLLTHTSGMGEATPQEGGAAKTLAEIIPVYAKKPLAFEPGSKWKYCQSSINTAGRVVEIVSGMPFEQFLAKRLFEPLGMKDTTFYMTEEQLPRLVPPIKRAADGKFEPAANMILYGKPATSRDRFPHANGGLFSTAPDYGRFAQMVLNGGSLDGKQYLKPESVKIMTSLHTGELVTGFTPGNGWGIGWCVVREPQGVTANVSSGTFGHGGAYGTQAWIDPKRGIAYVMMIQRQGLPNADGSEMRKTFHEAVNAALVRD